MADSRENGTPEGSEPLSFLHRALIYALKHPVPWIMALIGGAVIMHSVDIRLKQHDKQLTVTSRPVANEIQPGPASIPVTSKFLYEVRVRNDGIQRAERVSVELVAPHGIELQQEQVWTEPAGYQDDIQCKPKKSDEWSCEISRIDVGETVVLRFIGSSTCYIPSQTALRARVSAEDWSTREISQLNPIINNRSEHSYKSDLSADRLAKRVSDNRENFYVYSDQDSGFNHGFPSSKFDQIGTILISPGCVSNPADTRIGCFEASDVADLGATSSTVFRLTFNGVSNYASLNIEEPQKWGVRLADTDCAHVTYTCYGYDLRGATTVAFDVRSPVRISVALSGQAGEALSFPFSTQSFGVVPQGSRPIPPDQNNRNMTTTYDSALTMLALLHRGQQGDVANAIAIANAFDYSLFHDNHGDWIPQSPMMEQSGCYTRGGPNSSCGLRSAYEEGDIALLNDQYPPAMGQAADVRPAGFSVSQGSDLCGPSMFCLVQDGATGGNNAFAILALATAYQQTGNVAYLNDALIIGNWIINLQDTGPGYGGYFVGYNGYADPVQLHSVITGKSTENNADIFAAFSQLAQIEAALGNSSQAARWTNYANVAGNFVLAMYDPVNNYFNAGTVRTTMSGPGVCPYGPQRGNDIINTCPFLDAQSFPTLELAGSTMFGVPNPNSINWQLPTQSVLNYSTQSQSFGGRNEPSTLQNFTQTVTAGGSDYSGFDLIPALPSTGIAWEFTGQIVGACMYLDLLYNNGSSQNCVAQYQSQILEAANSAPFADGVGVVAATVQNGDMLPPGMQYLSTPFQCIPERVGLAATSCSIFAGGEIASPVLTHNSRGIHPENEARVRRTVAAQRYGHLHRSAYSPEPLTVKISNDRTTDLSVTSIASPLKRDYAAEDCELAAKQVVPLRVHVAHSGNVHVSVTSTVERAIP